MGKKVVGKRITWYQIGDGRIGYFDPYDEFGRFKCGNEYVRLTFGEIPKRLRIETARTYLNNPELPSTI